MQLTPSACSVYAESNFRYTQVIWRASGAADESDVADGGFGATGLANRASDSRWTGTAAANPQDCVEDGPIRRIGGPTSANFSPVLTEIVETLSENYQSFSAYCRSVGLLVPMEKEVG